MMIDNGYHATAKIRGVGGRERLRRGQLEISSERNGVWGFYKPMQLSVGNDEWNVCDVMQEINTIDRGRVHWPFNDCHIPCPEYT